MGYLVERAALIDRLFRALHLASARVPGSLAVATIVTCAIFATATGIVGAVVTLMGLLAFPAMLKAGYNIKVAAGCITAGGCLGILIPPSVLLIVYGATAGVSVVQLYAGAFFPGIMLASLYLGYVIVLAKLKPDLMPPLAAADRTVPLPGPLQRLSERGKHALTGLFRAVGATTPGVPKRTVLAQLFVSLVPFMFVTALLGYTYQLATKPVLEVSTAGLELSSGSDAQPGDSSSTGLGAPPEPEAGSGGLQEPPPEKPEAAAASGAAGELTPPPPEMPKSAPAIDEAPKARVDAVRAAAPAAERLAAPGWFWKLFSISVAILGIVYFLWTWERLQVFKMLLSSFFPLALMILAVLGSIVFGLATPTEAAAVGAFGGFVLAIAYRSTAHWRAVPTGQPKSSAIATSVRDLGSILKDSSFLTAKTSAMVCWLFIGSAIFSAAFALLGGQDLVEKWVLSMDLSPLQFMILAQFIIFILGWPLEWTEIIVIFMPIFIPLLPHFGIDPLFFGLLVALNLQTAFLSPPVAMAAFYLKGVAPKHVTLNQIFAGMLPFMAIQVVALVLLYVFPGIGLWLPHTLYK
jgi:TRAP-type mannitol/chloroaromatic compound transport system permease large subunit